MDIKDYISSGIIEQYVLGLATGEEVTELEQLRHEYPELNVAVLNFEQEFEAHLSANKFQPPAEIKSLLQKQLFGETSSEIIDENKVTDVPQNQPAKIYNITAWRYIAAACIILLIISTVLNFYFYSGFKGFKKLQDQYEALLIERSTLQANNASYKTSLDSIHQSINSLQANNEDYKNQVADLEQSFKILHNPDVKEIKLKGIADKSNLATIYWNTQTKQVYFFKNYMKEIPAGKQYQLWAIVHGKPVSAGLIGTCYGLCKMKIIPEAEAFAVTLEKEGGSDVPTLTAMFVMGKV